MDPYDVYLIHAYEDRETAEGICDALKSIGLSVWFNSFIPGQKLLKQMEDGLRQSTCGVVLVTNSIFKKKWALEEIDALYSLENPGEGRLIPVWVGVSFDQVRAASPMMSSRFAILHETSVATAGAIGNALMNGQLVVSTGQRLRSEVYRGLQWISGPSFLPNSFSEYDQHISDYYNVPLHRVTGGSDTIPRIAPEGGDTTFVPLRELLSSAPAFDGLEVAVIGTQRPHSVHVLTKMADLPVTLGHNAPRSLVSYVFQLTSTELPGNQFAYVHVIGPHAPGWGVPQAQDDELTLVVGLPMAVGSVPLMGGGVGQCVYLAARAVMFTPRGETPGASL